MLKKTSNTQVDNVAVWTHTAVIAWEGNSVRGPFGINWCASFFSFFFLLGSHSGMTLHQRDRWRRAPYCSLRLQQEPETNIFHSKGTSKTVMLIFMNNFFDSGWVWLLFIPPTPPPSPAGWANWILLRKNVLYHAWGVCVHRWHNWMIDTTSTWASSIGKLNERSGSRSG